ncbi:DinB family protein [Rossellomorea marisflavi]|uniref:DinB family protein n=1 Tax=Rossellomorea marisflavi TaxID=189381 RepID=UPI00279F6609|nr:DinB family protein [Rossellomorea marisflavi]UTE70923.1 DinB family protein [Rossellomorea marisflavi]
MKESITLITDIRKELLDEIQNLTDEDLNRTIHTNRWTIMQVVDHLYLMERAITASLIQALEQGDEQSVDDKPVHLTVDRSRKVQAPSYVEPTDEMKTLGEMKERLESSREELLHFLESIPSEDDLKTKANPHPVFGMVRLDQWVPFIGYHEKRHIDQIRELKADLI